MRSYMWAAFWLVVGACACLSVADLVTISPHLEFAFAARVVTVTILAATLWLGSRKPSARSVTWAALAVCGELLASTVLQDSVTRDPLATPLAAVGLALVAAWLLPWAMTDQAMLVILGVAAIVAHALVTHSSPDGAVLPVVLTAGSIPVAYSMSRQREALATARASASRLKDQFLANMSHEIRTPLNGVIGMVDVLRHSPLLPAQRINVETIYTCGMQLLSLVNDLLDFSKIEAGKLDIADVELDIGDVVAFAVQLFGARAGEKDLDLSYRIDMPPLAEFRGDPERLRQILVNLVSNAVKFTDHGHVSVRATVVEDGDAQALLRFDVEDSGPGVDPAARDRIFEEFKQADGAGARARGGAGLGLAIARRLARLMGGDLQFHGAPGSGSTFWFSARVDKAAPSAGEPQQLPNRRVLVAAAHPEHRARLSAELTRWGLRVGPVANIGEARAELDGAAQQRDPYDLALVEEGLSDLSAAALIGEIRKRSGGGRPAIGLVASSGRATDAPTALDAGAAFYLYLPVRRGRLFECLAALWSATDDEKERASTAPRYILVVEDNPLNQRVAVALIESLGYRAHVAGSGREALAALTTTPFDAILMDCQLPEEMDGFEITSRIRERELGTDRRTPVIALTASATQANRERCRAAGMDDFITKPIHRSSLHEVLSRWVDVSKPAHAPQALAPAEIDRALLHSVTGGDPVAVDHYARLFDAEVAGALQEIRNAAHGGDCKRVVKALHGLKGAAVTIGAIGVRNTISRLEEQARSNAVENVLPQLADLERACRLFLEAMRSGGC